MTHEIESKKDSEHDDIQNTTTLENDESNSKSHRKKITFQKLTFKRHPKPSTSKKKTLQNPPASSCCSFGKTIQSIKHDVRTDKRLQNRLKVCTFAICLMWATSLKVSYYIATVIAIRNTPPLSTVYKTCKNSYKIIQEEKSLYNTCVDIQLSQCFYNLEKYNSDESNKVLTNYNYNVDYIDRKKMEYDVCVNDYQTINSFVESWIQQSSTPQSNSQGSIDDYDNITIGLPISNDTCSAEEKEQLFNNIGGDLESLRSEAINLAYQFTVSSTSTISRLAQYGKVRSEYDYNYLQFHSNRMKQSVQNYMQVLTNQRITPVLTNDLLKAMSPLTEELKEKYYEAMSCIGVYELERKCKLPTTYEWGMKGANEFIDETVNNALTVKKVLRAHIFELYSKINKYVNNVKAAYDIVVSFYNGCKQFIQALQLDHLSNMGSWWDLKVSDMLAADVDWPESFPNVSQYIIKGVNAISSNVAQHKSEFDNYLDSIETTLSSKINDVVTEIKWNLLNADSLPNLLPDDYNPPKYVGANENITNVDDEKLLYEDTKKVFLSKSSDTFDTFAGIRKKFQNQNITIDVPTINITSYQNKFSEVDISFQEFTQPDIDFDIWFLKFMSISDVLFLLDFMLRIYFSLRLLFKYWDVTTIKLPEVDIRTDKEVFNPFRMSSGRLFVIFITSPFVAMFCLGLISTWTFKAIYSIYSPLYTEYLNGCVPINGNGTFTTVNLFSMSYNYAYQDGSSKLVKGLELFDSKKGQYCSKAFSESLSNYNDHRLELSMYSKAFLATSEQMSIFDKCIMFDALDEQYRMACCGVQEFMNSENSGCKSWNGTINNNVICPFSVNFDSEIPLYPPGAIASRKSCNDERVKGFGVDNLLNEVFECDMLPKCQITCSGPQKSKIKTVTKECGCMLEWFAHSKWLEALLAFFIFCCLNASRIGFIDGLGRVIWEKLRPGTFTVHATCDVDGSLISKSYDAKKDSLSNIECNDRRDSQGVSQGKGNSNINKLTSIHLADRLKKKIRKNIFLFRMGGWLIMLISISLNIPWILIVVKADTTRPDWLHT